MRIYRCAYPHRYSRCILSSRTCTRGLHLFPQVEPLEPHPERRRERPEFPPVPPSEPPSEAERLADREKTWEQFEKEHCIGNIKDIFEAVVPSTTRLEGPPEDWEAEEDWPEVPVGVRPFV